MYRSRTGYENMKNQEAYGMLQRTFGFNYSLTIKVCCKQHYISIPTITLALIGQQFTLKRKNTVQISSLKRKLTWKQDIIPHLQNLHQYRKVLYLSIVYLFLIICTCIYMKKSFRKTIFKYFLSKCNTVLAKAPKIKKDIHKFQTK